ncbi:PilW family protein [Anaeromyxobacter terrae]|uniref:PilW family protein n=1 Tax=Anaeromyxobacter terrae TaxID=2925406 RepID=UPI001F573819|nr:PilW family protein [Anaeromyxobacter sp. SG22]
MCSRSSARGVTLVELLVAMTISSVVMVGIIATVSSQQQAYAAGHRVRAAQASARNALLTLEQLLPRAGYGMAPSLAFDFDRYTTGPCPAQLESGGACKRDRTDDSDELVFYARNASYWLPPSGVGTPTGRTWTVTTAGVTTTQANLSVRNGDKFRKGQILQIICEGASQYVYVTVKTNTVATAAGAWPVELETYVTADPFRRQDAATDDCFKAGTARVYQIDRYRLHVRPVAVGDRFDPFLVLDHGVDVEGSSAGVDADDEEFVAEGIESFQVAYVLANGQVVGATPGTAITFATAAAPGSATTTNTITKLTFPGAAPEPDESIYSPTSWYRYLANPPDPERLTDHQANVRAVRISVVARSPDPDLTRAGTPPMLRLNQSTPAAWAGAADARDGYERVAFEATIPLPNMLSQGMVFF